MKLSTLFSQLKLILFIFSLPVLISSQILNPGDIDKTFGDNGKITINIHSGFQMRDFAIQPDGKILVFGIATNNQIFKSHIYRFDKNGILDLTFNHQGWLTISDFILLPTKVVVQNDGKIIVGGRIPGQFVDIGIIRLLESGEYDKTFGDEGFVHIDFSQDEQHKMFDSLDTILLYENGNMLLVGSSIYQYGNQNYLSLARLMPNGLLDNNFGNKGKIFEIRNTFAIFNSALIQTSGKILIAGSLGDNNQDLTTGMIRYESNGTRDMSFGQKGVVTVSDQFGLTPFTLLTQDDGKVLFSGFINKSCRNCIVRYDEDGNLDSTFGQEGIINVSFLETGNTSVSKYAIQRDNKILAFGAFFGTQSNNQSGFGLARFLPNGESDPTFGINGVVLTTIGNDNYSNLSLDIQPDGRIIAGGHINTSSSNECILIRYLYRRPRARGKF